MEISTKENLKSLLPNKYTKEEKEKILLLLIDLANIYLNIKEED